MSAVGSRSLVARCAAPLLALLAIGFAAGAQAQAQAPEDPPLRISADNMSGSHAPEGDVVVLTGNVRIHRGRTVLTADHGRYLRAEGMLHLEGNVRMVDSSTIVTCERASYSEPDDLVQLSGNVTLEDREATLHAPAATYDRRTGRAELYGGVTGSDAERTVTCDRAFYHRDSLLLQARGNVRSRDEKNKLDLDAREVDYDRRTHEVVATGDPSLSAEDERGHRAVIRARTMRLNTETRVAEAIDSVQVERDSLKASGDYGLFDDRAQRGWLLGNPRAWDDETTVTGDTLEMWTDQRQLERLVVRNRATVEYRGLHSENQGESSRLAGSRVDVHFRDDEIDSLVAIGKASNDYRAVPLAGKTAERNHSEGDTITVYFLRGKIDRARVQGGARGEYALAADAADTSAAARDVIRYDATDIGYDVSKNRIVLDGSAHMIYRDLELKSRRVEFDVDRQTLVATGKPELVERGDKVDGHLMTYDLDTRVGNIYQAETAYEKGLYHGRRIRKVNENVLEVLNGSYSTCDLDQPHYHFSSRWMKIYLKDKLVAKPVVFYIDKVPLLALPFWIFPIKPGRHSGFLFPQFEFGFTNKAGQFIRNAGYYWAPNDYMDVTVSGDYYQFEPSWVARSVGLYKKLYVLDGNFRGSFARNQNPDARSENWDFHAQHFHTLSPRTRLVAEADFVSSRDYNSSNLYGRSLSQRLNRFLDSRLAFTHSADWASFNMALDRHQDLDADDAIVDPDGEGPLQGRPPGTVAPLANLVETLPTLSIGFPTRIIGSFGLFKGTRFEKGLSTLYFGLDTRFVSTRQRNAVVSGYRYFTNDDSLSDSTTTIVQRESKRRGAAANTSLSDSRRLFGWLNMQPSVSANAVVFDFDELGNKVVPVGTWSSAVATGTTFYGTFWPRLGALEGIRHVVAPTVSFSYSPEFQSLLFVDSLGVKRSRFRSFTGIGISGFEQFLLNFNVNQRLQVKLKHGEREQKLDNLVSWSLGGSYDFLYRERGALHPLSNIGSNVSIQPPGVLSGNLFWSTNVYNPRPVQSLSYNLGLNLTSSKIRRDDAPELPVDANRREYDDFGSGSGESWALDLAYSYSGGYRRANQWASNQTGNLVFRYQVTPAWGFDYSASYDVTNRELGIQSFALSRDLHCWQARFTRTFAPGGEAEYYFRLEVKNQRELFIERGTRTGSIGGLN